MTSAERLGLIRAKAKREAVAAPTKPKERYWVPHTASVFQLRTIEGLKPKSLNVHSEWLREQDLKPVKEWQPSQRHQPHALTRIAEKLKRDWQK